MKVQPRFPTRSHLALTLVLGAAGCGQPSRGSPEPASQSVTHSLAAGEAHTCAIQMAGLFCWGANSYGELGTGVIGPPSGPVAASAAGKDVVEVGANSLQTCVRRASGGVDCWGANDQGGLGDGTQINRATPVPVLGIDDAEEIAAGGPSACARRKGGTVACWGAYSQEKAAENGILPAPHGSLVPFEVDGLAAVVELRTSQPGSRYCARTSAGDVSCWNVDSVSPVMPEPVPVLAGTHGLALDVETVCALTTSNQVLCADGSMNGRLVEDVDDAVELVGTATALCWRRASGDIGCEDRSGVILGTPGLTRRDFLLDAPAVELAGGQVHFCARVEDGGVECFNDPWPGTGSAAALVRVAGLPP